jgi:hypothetical protein
LRLKGRKSGKNSPFPLVMFFVLRFPPRTAARSYERCYEFQRSTRSQQRQNL